MQTLTTIAAAKGLIDEGYRLDIVKQGDKITAAKLLKDGAQPVDLNETQAVALEVYVRQNGAVAAPAPTEDWTTFTPDTARSSHIAMYRYKKEGGILEVRFRKEGKPGALYRGEQVTPEEFEALHTAASLTSHLNTKLRNALIDSKRPYGPVNEEAPITDVITPLAQSIAAEAEKRNPSPEPRAPSPDAPELALLLFEVTNHQRLEFFRHEFDAEDNLILIGGENGNGKTSLLDSVQMLFEGPLKRIKRPIREGTDMCKVKGIIGDADTREPLYEVRRWNTGDGWALKIVRAGTDDPVKNPADLLKDIMGPVTDPTEIIRMEPRDLRAYLIDVCELHLDDLDAKIAAANQTVKDMEGEKTRLKNKYADLPEHPEAGTEEVTYADLRAKLSEAITHNRQGVDLESAKARAEGDVITATNEIERLEDLLAAAKQRQFEAEKAVDDAAEALANFTRKDEEAIAAEINGIEDTNRKVRDNVAKANARAEAQACESKIGIAVGELTAAKQAKLEALAKANFPVEGLGFSEEDGFVTFNGQPFQQASDGEKIRVAAALALARRGALPLLYIRNASLWDGKSLRLFADEAAKYRAQVLGEIVTNRSEAGHDRECTIYIHEGKVDEKGFRVPAPQEAA